MFEENQIVRDVYPLLKHKSSILFEVTQDLVQPRFSNSIDTACVSFVIDDEDVNASFEFNPVFWSRLNINEKFFVFAHEVLHVLFFHGSRGKKFLDELPEDQRNYKILNVAMDICINERLLNDYTDVPLSCLPVLKDMMCNIENCFPKRAGEILKGKSFDYYYMELLKDSNEEMQSFDIHDFLTCNDSDRVNEKMDAAIESIVNSSDIEKIKEDKIPSAYAIADDKSGSVSHKLTPPKHKLEEYIDLFMASRFGGNEPLPKYKHIWHKTSRRMTGVSYGQDIHVPFKEKLPKKKGKNTIVVYADVSGSVAGYSTIFMNLIGGLDETKFEMDIYAFASRVVNTHRKNGAISYSNAGGGTDIHKVLGHYQRNYHDKPPDATLILTDGRYSTIKNLDSEHFKDWVFFMTRSNSNYPKKSKSIILKL